MLIKKKSSGTKCLDFLEKKKKKENNTNYFDQREM